MNKKNIKKAMMLLVLASPISLISCTNSTNTRIMMDMNAIKVDSKDDVNEAMANYELNYHYQDPGENYSCELLWRGYDGDRYNGFYGSKTRRLSTYLNEYGKDEDEIYLLYLKTSDIPEYQDYLKKTHIYKGQSRDDYSILFYDEEDTLKIDGKYLYARQRSENNGDYVVAKVNEISEIALTIDDYTLAFAAKRKPVKIKEDVSAGTKYNSNIIYAYHQVRLQFSDSNSTPSLMEDDASKLMDNGPSSYVGERLEVFHPSSIISGGISAPLLGMSAASSLFSGMSITRYEILTYDSKQCISLPHYANYGKENQWDLLDSNLDVDEFSDIYFEAKDDFKDALAADLDPNKETGYGLFDYEKVAKIIKKYHEI